MPADITTLYPLVSPFVGACPVPLQKQALIRAARNFCRETEWWKEDLVTLTTDSDETDYQLRVTQTGTHDGGDGQAIMTDSTAAFTVDALIGFYLFNTTDGSHGIITDNDATTITATLAGGTENDWDDDDVYEVRTHQYDARIHRVEIVKIEDTEVHESHWTITRDYVLEFDEGWPSTSDEDLDVNVALWPEASCTEYPQILLDKWDQCIADGAMGYLFAMTGKPWADKEEARRYMRSHNDGVAQAKEEILTKRKGAEVQIVIPELI